MDKTKRTDQDSFSYALNVVRKYLNKNITVVLKNKNEKKGLLNKIDPYSNITLNELTIPGNNIEFLILKE